MCALMQPSAMGTFDGFAEDEHDYDRGMVLWEHGKRMRSRIKTIRGWTWIPKSKYAKQRMIHAHTSMSVRAAQATLGSIWRNHVFVREHCVGAKNSELATISMTTVL